MQKISQWRIYFIAIYIILTASVFFCVAHQEWRLFIALVLVLILFGIGLLGTALTIHRYGIRTQLDISRVLGKDAKEALDFGDIGILVYNDEFVVTWASSYFSRHHIDIENKKVTAWLPSIKELFNEDSEVDTINGEYEGRIYEISRKENSQVLFVKDITEVTKAIEKLQADRVVIGIMQLDNYIEYQSYEDEELISRINMRLRAPLIAWAKDNGMFVRRLRSDRLLLVLDYAVLKKVKTSNFTILQLIKDEAQLLDVSITLSMAFAYGSTDFTELDTMVNDLIEMAQSRGGDQCVIKEAGHSAIFIGGNSEAASARSKVRVRIMAHSIQEAIQESKAVYIGGHINSDFDCMGAALAMASWAKALGKPAYIVLKDVPRDRQLQLTMDHYKGALDQRVLFVSPSEAKATFDPDKDLLVLVDHSNPAISSVRNLLDEAKRVLIIDHHRRSEQFISHPMLTYIESSASSTCELVGELLQNVPNHIPVYEAEATIMYLGVLVDTNRFKMHTSARTFETVATLKNWGANSQIAEKALQEEEAQFKELSRLVSQGERYLGDFMICATDEPISRTMLSKVSDDMLNIKGTKASFTIAPNINDETKIAISARSDGSFNVQRIMEQMKGGGHFAAAALERENTSVKELQEELERILKEDVENESHSA